MSVQKDAVCRQEIHRTDVGSTLFVIATNIVKSATSILYESDNSTLKGCDPCTWRPALHLPEKRATKDAETIFVCRLNNLKVECMLVCFFSEHYTTQV